MHARDEIRRLRWVIFIALLTGALAPGGVSLVRAATPADRADTWIAAAVQCMPADGSIELVVQTAEVIQRRNDAFGQPSCEEALAPEDSRLLAESDTIVVGETGRASLHHGSSPRLMVFGNSSVTVEPDLVADGRSYPQLLLEQGAMNIDRPVLTLKDAQASMSGDETSDIEAPPVGTDVLPGTSGPPELVIATAAGVLTSIEGSFFVYAAPDGFTWLVVSGGAVEVTANGKTVLAPAGWQTWIEPNAQPQRPLPATRSVVDVQFQGNLPTIGELTGDQVREDTVFAACGVTAPTGTDVRFGPEFAHPVLDQVDAGSMFAPSYRASDVAWVFGAGTEGLRGWTESSNLDCPYDPMFLPTSDDVDADAVPDLIDTCADRYNPDQADADLDRIGDVCEPELAAPTALSQAEIAAPTELPEDDSDGDGIPDGGDNCPGVPNPDRSDTGSDLRGDVCDPEPTPTGLPPIDSDDDGVPDGAPDQCGPDSDGDLVGDDCDVDATPPALNRDQQGL